MKVCIIAETGLNWSAAVALPYVRRELEDRGISYIIRKASERSNSFEYATEAIESGMDAVLAIGGDDIASDASRALAGTDIALVLLPCGSKRGFGQSLGLPETPSSAVSLLTEGNRIAVDMARVNQDPYLCTAMTGFGAESQMRLQKMGRLLPEPRPYLAEKLVGGITALFTYKPTKFRIHHDGGVDDIVASMITVNNSSSYGSANLSRESSLFDGKLDVCILEQLPRRRLAYGLTTYAAGGMSGAAEAYTCLKTSRLWLESSTPFKLAADGRMIDSELPLYFDVMPGGLSVMVPQRNEVRVDSAEKRPQMEDLEGIAA